jgi:ATP-dependent RNA helicase DeaD
MSLNGSHPALHPALAKALADRGYANLTPVQEAMLPAADAANTDLLSRDLLVSAKTGSGKTVAYGLALAKTLLGEAETLPRAGAPLALIIAPTRELALQVHRELEWLYASAGAKVVSCVGGMDPRREQRALAEGAHIVVGTPGRLRDHIERGNLITTSLRAVVLDEADEMLDLGFREELEEILDATPPERRTLLFSATLPKPIVALAKTYQRDALRIAVAGGETSHADIEYRVIGIGPSEVENAVVNVLRFFDPGAALVFCSTREAVRKLHASLVERGFDVVALSGELSQSERTHALQALRDRRARVCVATDVAARGIDIPDLELVVHAELPADAQTLQHRSGRTGRAGRKGICVVLATHPRRRRAEMILRAAHVDATWGPPPSADEIRALDQTRLLAQVGGTDEVAEEDLAAAKLLIAERTSDEIAIALARLNRSRLPAPEDLMDSGPAGAPSARGSAQQGQGYQGGADRGGEGGGPRRAGFEDSLWFRIDMGRNRNADPRWLLPMICRRGHITKTEIGAIRVYERETRFEIAREAAPRFAAALRKAEDDGVRIEALAEGAGADPGQAARPQNRSRPSFKGGYKGKNGGGERDGGHAAAGAKPPYRAKPKDKSAPRSKPYGKPPRGGGQ